MSFFQHYRYSQVGLALQEVMDEMVEADLLDVDTQNMMLLQFDKAISSALSTCVKTKASLRGDLDHYRNVENIWTFYLKNAVIKLENVEHRVDDRLRIIACDGRTPSTGAGGGKKAKK
ncbi:hypothetical protein BU14_0103s0027 [Porphyra umbilicalis]|uniref:Transcription initiation factor IIA subunit 2 n=1 Tax=Porphyra umbilicalis TaxID=2786 RepID=A0A1X6PCT7_PORUM|nr:hypothetical protein BU14_0103s0027 [Porphyra umbilicalis]|eukprot:OSX78682.1 hypothetical protein BU14_0103s0027 [Porphyra umbilicalis]